MDAPAPPIPLLISNSLVLVDERKFSTQVQPVSVECIKSATMSQQEKLGEILDIIGEIFQIELRRKKYFNGFLKNLGNIVHFCAPILKNGGKAAERILSAQISNRNETIKTAIKLFAEWKAILDGYIEVYRSQVPHQMTYLLQIKEIDQKYQDISDHIERISKVQVELRKRLGEDNRFLPADDLKAINMISAVYNLSVEAMTKDILDYRTRTYAFRAVQTHIKYSQEGIDEKRKKFERSFCLLSYLIKHDYQCTYLTESAYFQVSGFDYLTSRAAINDMWDVYGDPLFNKPTVAGDPENKRELTKELSYITDEKNKQGTSDGLGSTSDLEMKLNSLPVKAPNIDDQTLLEEIQEVLNGCKRFLLFFYLRNKNLNDELDKYKKNPPPEKYEQKLEDHFLAYLKASRELNPILEKRKTIELKIINLPSKTSNSGYMSLCNEQESLNNAYEEFLRLFNLLTFLHAIQHPYSDLEKDLFNEGYKNGKYHFFQTVLQHTMPLSVPLLKIPIFFEKYLGNEGIISIKPLLSKSVKFIKAATRSQQEKLGEILKTFEETFQIDLKTKDNFDDFLNKSKEQIRFCSPILINGEKATDNTLFSLASSLNKTIITVTTLFTQWKATLDSYLDVYTYRDPAPHQKTYLLQIIRIDQQYQNISDSMGKISKVKGKLVPEIKKRLAKDNLYLPANDLRAINMISAVYNISVGDIKEDIFCYHENTTNIRGVYKYIKDSHKKMNIESKNFTRSFCLLSYLVKHNYQCSYLTETAYFPVSGFDYLTSRKAIKDMWNVHGDTLSKKPKVTADQTNPGPEKQKEITDEREKQDLPVELEITFVSQEDLPNPAKDPITED